MIAKPSNWDTVAAYDDARIDVRIEIAIGTRASNMMDNHLTFYSSDVDSNGVTLEMASGTNGSLVCRSGAATMTFTLMNIGYLSEAIVHGALCIFSIRLVSDAQNAASSWVQRAKMYIDDTTVNDDGSCTVRAGDDLFVPRTEYLYTYGDEERVSIFDVDGKPRSFVDGAPAYSNSYLQNVTVPMEYVSYTARKYTARDYADWLSTIVGKNYIVNNNGLGDFIPAKTAVYVYRNMSILDQEQITCANVEYIDNTLNMLAGVKVSVGDEGEIYPTRYSGLLLSAQIPSNIMTGYANLANSISLRLSGKGNFGYVHAYDVEMSPLLQLNDMVQTNKIYEDDSKKNYKVFRFAIRDAKMTFNGNCWGELTGGIDPNNAELHKDTSSYVNTVSGDRDNPQLIYLGNGVFKIDYVPIDNNAYKPSVNGSSYYVNDMFDTYNQGAFDITVEYNDGTTGTVTLQRGACSFIVGNSVSSNATNDEYHVTHVLMIPVNSISAFQNVKRVVSTTMTIGSSSNTGSVRFSFELGVYTK